MTENWPDLLAAFIVGFVAALVWLAGRAYGRRR
jgi:hypothetical protein